MSRPPLIGHDHIDVWASAKRTSRLVPGLEPSLKPSLRKAEKSDNQFYNVTGIVGIVTDTYDFIYDFC